jgi:hypothetical protein
MKNELLHFAKASGKQCLGYLLLMIVMNIFFVSTVIKNSFMIESIFLIIFYIMLNGYYLFFLLFRKLVPSLSMKFFNGVNITHFQFFGHTINISIVGVAFLNYLWRMHIRFPKDPFLNFIFFLF